MSTPLKYIRLGGFINFDLDDIALRLNIKTDLAALYGYTRFVTYEALKYIACKEDNEDFDDILMDAKCIMELNPYTTNDTIMQKDKIIKEKDDEIARLNLMFKTNKSDQIKKLEYELNTSQRTNMIQKNIILNNNINITGLQNKVKLQNKQIEELSRKNYNQQFNSKSSPYADLHLDDNCDLPTVKKMFHGLSLLLHPDKQILSNDAAFKKINAAYSSIINSRRY
jgi:hypothetical protein